jgi:hypothetical protein
LNQEVDFEEILYGGDAVEDDFEGTSFNAVASTVINYRTFKLLRWKQGKAD